MALCKVPAAPGQAGQTGQRAASSPCPPYGVKPLVLYQARPSSSRCLPSTQAIGQGGAQATAAATAFAQALSQGGANAQVRLGTCPNARGRDVRCACGAAVACVRGGACAAQACSPRSPLARVWMEPCPCHCDPHCWRGSPATCLLPALPATGHLHCLGPGTDQREPGVGWYRPGFALVALAAAAPDAHSVAPCSPLTTAAPALPSHAVHLHRPVAECRHRDRPGLCVRSPRSMFDARCSWGCSPCPAASGCCLPLALCAAPSRLTLQGALHPLATTRHQLLPAYPPCSSATAQGGNSAALATATAQALAQAGNQCCDKAAQVGRGGVGAERECI